jgi:hypothetical protein
LDFQFALLGLATFLIRTERCIRLATAMASSSSSAGGVARATFELENEVVTLDPRSDSIFLYDDAQQAKIRDEAPWKKE